MSTAPTSGPANRSRRPRAGRSSRPPPAPACAGRGGPQINLIQDLALGIDLAAATGAARTLRTDFCVRFQQTCGPVMAKGAEDTACYRYHRLVAAHLVQRDQPVAAVAR